MERVFCHVREPSSNKIMRKTLISYLIIFIYYTMNSMANENFFTDISNLLPDQDDRLSYGVAVSSGFAQDLQWISHGLAMD